MTHGKILISFFITMSLFSSFAFGKQTQFNQPVFNIFEVKFFDFRLLEQQSLFSKSDVSEQVAYEQLFRLIVSFEKKAVKLASEGNPQRAEFLRNFLPTKAGLSREQAATLKTNANSFMSESGQIKNRYKMKRASKTENLSFWFDNSEREREQLFLEYRTRLRNLLGENGFASFARFVQEKIASRISYREDRKNQSILLSMSMIEYNQTSDEVFGYSSTAEFGGHEDVVNIVYATLTSDSAGLVDFQSTEECNEVAEVYLFASGTTPAETFCIDGEHQFITCQAYLRPDKTGKNNKLGYGCSCPYDDTQNLPPTEDCLTTPPLPNVTGVNFQTIAPNNLPINTNPNIGDGLRIFPDDNEPLENANRQTIRVTASISESVAGRTVYFRNFDIDDPSDDMTIDPNGNLGDDNNGRVNGFGEGQLSAVSAQTNANGIATVNFTVTMQPGDNFAIAATTDQDEIGSVMVDGTELTSGSGATIQTSCDETDTVCRTEMLTIWRRLHIEVDSMGEAQGNFVVGNIAESALIGTFETDVQVNTSQQLEVNRFENGRLVSGSRSFRVISNTADTVRISVFFGGTVKIGAGEIFQLYDDDDFNDNNGTTLNGDTGEDIPMSDTSLSLLTANSDDPTTNILAPAYVRPVYDVVDPRDNSFFQPNAFGDFPADTRRLFVDRDLTSTNVDVEFWTVYILGSYQHTLIEDNDPTATEIPTFGIADGIPLTALGDGSGVLIFLEAHNSKEIADYPASPDLRRIANTVGHEVGHLLSGRHGDGDIMTDASGVLTSNRFSPTTIRRIRAELLNP